jgi:hypothetical protein
MQYLVSRYQVCHVAILVEADDGEDACAAVERGEGVEVAHEACFMPSVLKYEDKFGDPVYGLPSIDQLGEMSCAGE